MAGSAGDWRVSDDSGRSWSVADTIFRETYQHIAGDRWARSGTVTARPALPGEVIKTLEGDATAAAGDWIVRGQAGECWPVPGELFEQRYAPISSEGGSTGRAHG